MTVRYQGLPTFTTGDFYRTDRGVTWGIKCSSVGGVEFVNVFVKNPDGSWGIEQNGINSILDDGFDINIGSYANVLDWFIKKFIPALNAWLKARFPANVAAPGQPPVPPPPSTLTPIQEADLLINTRLLITVNPDGTLTASLK